MFEYLLKANITLYYPFFAILPLHEQKLSHTIRDVAKDNHAFQLVWLAFLLNCTFKITPH